MAIKTSCPECDKEYNLPDEMEGKTVKCKGCSNLIQVESAASLTTVTTKPAKGMAKPGAIAKKVGKPSVRNDDYQDDREQATPKIKKSSLGMWLLVGGGLVAALMLFVCAGGGLGAYFLFFSGTKTNYDNNPPLKADLPPAPPLENKLPGNPPPASTLNVDNYMKIKGGMSANDVKAILGPSQATQKPDTQSVFTAGDRGIAHVWTNGADTITVNFNPEDKAVCWTAKLGGKRYDSLDMHYAVKHPSTLTKDNYNRIMGGESEEKIALEIFTSVGFHTRNTGEPETANYDNANTVVWQDSSGFVMITFCNGKAAHWTGLIDNRQMESKTNQIFVTLKGK